MYYKQIEWLEQAARDSLICTLRNKRKEKHLELIYLKYEQDKALRILGIVSNAYYKAKEEYQEIDLDLSFIDGRYSICEVPKEKGGTRKKKKKSKEIDLKTIPKDQINSLIDELLKMKAKNNFSYLIDIIP